MGLLGKKMPKFSTKNLNFDPTFLLAAKNQAKTRYSIDSSNRNSSSSPSRFHAININGKKKTSFQTIASSSIHHFASSSIHHFTLSLIHQFARVLSLSEHEEIKVGRSLRPRFHIHHSPNQNPRRNRIRHWIQSCAWIKRLRRRKITYQIRELYALCWGWRWSFQVRFNSFSFSIFISVSPLLSMLVILLHFFLWIDILMLFYEGVSMNWRFLWRLEWKVWRWIEG